MDSKLAEKVALEATTNLYNEFLLKIMVILQDLIA